VIGHTDEDGKPCTRHAPADAKLLAYAALGTRVTGFHHDAASKLQSLVMALDEIGELIGEAESDIRTATETAQMAVRQLHTLLTANRALAKAPTPTRMHVPELLQRAAERYSVKLRGQIGGIEVMAAPPSITHAVSLLLDMVAGPPAQGRTVEVEAVTSGGRVTLTMIGNVEPTHQHLNELIAVATFMFEREQGSLRCGTKRFVVELPLAQ
jgi:hypothetical protein